VARPSFLSPFLRGPDRRYVLHNTRNGLAVATNIEVALDSASRRRGLLGRDGLDTGAALVIAPCNAVHTFFMRFAIDAVFLDRELRVRKIVACLKPFRLASSLGARSVVELAAGEAARVGLAEGMRLSWHDQRDLGR
jgi:hypothetical protein